MMMHLTDLTSEYTIPNSRIRTSFIITKDRKIIRIPCNVEGAEGKSVSLG